jgi:hypothetical protein
LSQTLAQRIEARGLSLQLTEFRGQCIQLPMSILAQITQLPVLLFDLLMQRIDLSKRAIARAGHGQRNTSAQTCQSQHRSGANTQDTPAKTLIGEVQCFGHLPCT